MSKSDKELKAAIEEELGWDPMVNASRVGVSVTHGAVALMGVVDTYAEKWAVEAATKRVAGVRTVAQDLTVKVLDEHQKTDAEIARAVQHALSWNVFVPSSITATVNKGHVTLDGTSSWNFQRTAAEDAVSLLPGVTYVTNVVRLKSHTSAAQVKDQVVAALKRQAVSDADKVKVEVDNGEVTLTGDVSSWHMEDQIYNSAWATTGVTKVTNKMHFAGAF